MLLQRENEDLKRQLDMAKRARVFCESLTTPHQPAPGVKTIRPPQENPVHQGAPKGAREISLVDFLPIGGRVAVNDDVMSVLLDYPGGEGSRWG